MHHGFINYNDPYCHGGIQNEPKKVLAQGRIFGPIRKMASVVVSFSQVSDSDADEPPTPMKAKPVKPKAKSEKKNKNSKEGG